MIDELYKPINRVSSISSEPLCSIGGFALFYTVLLVIEIYLMFKYVRLGPSSLHIGRYCFEQSSIKGVAYE